MNFCGLENEQQENDVCSLWNGPRIKFEDGNVDGNFRELSLGEVDQRRALDRIEHSITHVGSDEAYFSPLDTCTIKPTRTTLAENNYSLKSACLMPGRKREDREPRILEHSPTSSHNESRTATGGALQASSPMANWSPSYIVPTSNSSPIPLYLISDDEWSSTHKPGQATLKNTSLDPPLGQSFAQGSIEVRLEDGYDLTLHTRSVGAESVHLYLTSDHSHLYVHRKGEWEKGEINAWTTIALKDILRLELGGPKQNRAHTYESSFTIIVDQESSINYFDFEAASPVQREYLLSSLMVVLEQECTSLQTRKNSDDVECIPNAGTMDQPILCSPSLEQNTVPSRPSPQNLESKVSSRECLYLDEHDAGSVSKIFIDSGERQLPKDADKFPFQNQESSGPMVGMTQEEKIDLCIGFVPSASSVYLADAWCTDDVCTLAMKDIADSCAGIFEKKQIRNGSASFDGCVSPVDAEQMAMVEDYVTGAMEAPSAVYSYLTADGRVWQTDKPMVLQTASHVCTHPVLKNRASQANAQVHRLQRLRSEMTFADPLRQSEERTRCIRTTQSCADIPGLKVSYPKIKADNDGPSLFHTSDLLKSVMNNTMMSRTNDGQKIENDVLYYDSDPEDIRFQSTCRNPRKASAKPEAAEKNINAARRPLALSGVGFEQMGSGKQISRHLDEDVIVDLVRAMNNERLPLLWHPIQTKELSNRSPINVKVWIESGVYLVDGTFLLPKLTWSESAKAIRCHASVGELQKLDLLDICRIRATLKIDRKLHPFADRRKCFLIETQTKSYLFEAQSTEERERIVSGLKLVVARLASLLMVRDFRAAEEFFGQISTKVPGQSPSWATK
jgi:hypothetical protein